MTWAYRRLPVVKSHEEEREERWLEEWLRKRTTVSREWLAEKRSMRSVVTSPPLSSGPNPLSNGFR
jgi:hypothetical protein